MTKANPLRALLLASLLSVGVVATSQISLVGSVLAQGTKAVSEDAKESEVRLDQAFTTALKAIDEQRRTNNASEFSCWHFFVDSGFYRFRKVEEKLEPYIAFFKKIGIPVKFADHPKEHHIYVELTHNELLSRGYKNFRYGDRLVIGFTTSKESGEITSFVARLFGRTMP